MSKSKTTRHGKKNKVHVIMHHAKQPHGIASIAVLVFVMAWAVWTFVIW